jgi:hypothetical protein
VTADLNGEGYHESGLEQPLKLLAIMTLSFTDLRSMKPVRGLVGAIVFASSQWHWEPMQDLEEMIERLLETARKLPPGPERKDALKEVGRFRVRLEAISKKSNSLSERSPIPTDTQEAK